MSRARMKVAGCVVALAVLGAACSDDGGGSDDDEATTPTTVKYEADKKVASPAVDLRTTLTTLIQEHVLLSGIASSLVVAGQDPGPAVTAIDQNSVALSDQITQLYGPPAGQQFLDLWRRHAGLILEFAAGSAAADPARIAKAKTDMTAAQGEIATVLNSVNNQLTTDAMGEAFETYATSLQSAITAQAKKDAKAVAKLKEAADESSSTAIVMVAAIVKDKGKELPGDIDAISAAMRTQLAAKLQQHAYLAGLASATALTGGDVASVSKPLDENSLELSRAIAAVYDDDAGRNFLKLWRQHIAFFVSFTEGAGAGDRVRMGLARQDLDSYRTAFGAFLNSANPNLSKEDLVAELGVHVDSLLAAIEAQAAKDPAHVVKLREAAGHMPATALYLATGIARQFPAKFG